MLGLGATGETSITREVHTLLWDLNSVKMPGLPDSCERSRSFTEALRELPRSGKLVRIHRFGLELPVQSHYDHLLAVAKIAEIVAGSRPFSLDAKKWTAQCVAFHDLPELLTGDLPDWTSLELIQGIKGISTGVTSVRALVEISESLPADLQRQFDRTCTQLEQAGDESFRIFKFADKIEPILAIWRYLRFYKDRLDVDGFLNAMTDFFENPNVVHHCCDDEQRDAVRFFQSRNAALQYLAGGLPELIGHPCGLRLKLLSDVVSRLKMHTVA